MAGEAPAQQRVSCGAGGGTGKQGRGSPGSPGDGAREAAPGWPRHGGEGTGGHALHNPAARGARAARRTAGSRPRSGAAGSGPQSPAPQAAQAAAARRPSPTRRPGGRSPSAPPQATMPGPSRFFGPLAVAAAAAATHCPGRSRDKRRGRQPVAEPHRATAHAPAVTAPASRLRRGSSRPSPSAPLASYCARPAGFPLPSLPRPAARDPLALTGRGARALLAPGPRRPRPRPPFAPAPAGGSASAARDCVADWAGGKGGPGPAASPRCLRRLPPGSRRPGQLADPAAAAATRSPALPRPSSPAAEGAGAGTNPVYGRSGLWRRRTRRRTAPHQRLICSTT